MQEIEILADSQKKVCIIVDPIQFWQITTTSICMDNIVG